MSEGNGEVRRKILSRKNDEFLGLHPVPIEEWGVTVYFKGLSGKERDRTEDEYDDLRKKARGNLRASVLVRCLLDENGQRIFSNDDADELGDNQAPILDYLFNLAIFYAGMSKGQRDDTLKNSSAGPAESKSSNSPEPTDKLTATAG